MAKRPAKKSSEEPLSPLSALRPTPPRTVRKWCIAITMTGVAVTIITVLVCWALPDELPMILQRLLGPVCAGLAVAVLAWTTRETESAEEEALSRARRGQHADFGKRLREAQKERTTVKLPLLGETSIRGLAAVGVFVVVEAWWLSPIAPIGIRRRAIADLSVPLAEEIVAVVLATPDTNMAVVLPPVPPVSIRKLAEAIDEDQADFYNRGLKAIALGRFKDARGLLAKAMSEEDSLACDIRVARAQNDMYAGQFEDAVGWYRNALNDKPDDPILLCQMAVACMQLGRFHDAQSLIARARQACGAPLSDGRETTSPGGRETGPDESTLAMCLHVEVVVNVCLGKQYDQSIQMCVRTREILNSTLQRQHPFEAASLNNHATLYLLQAKYQGGHELYSRAIDLWSRPSAPRHPYASSGLANLAILYCLMGEYAKDPKDGEANDEAKELAAAALKEQRRELPETHPILGITYNANAVVAVALAHYEDAQPLAEKSLAIFEAASKRDSDTEDPNGTQRKHGTVAAALDTLAMTYAGKALYTRAGLYCNQALEVAQKAWGPKHPYLVGILIHLADLRIEQGRFVEAEARCVEALDIAKASFGENHPIVASVLNTRGKLEIARGTPLGARPFLEEANAILEKAFGPERAHGMEHPRLAETIGLMAALNATSPLDYAQGVKRYMRAIEILDKRFGLEHPRTARLLCKLADLYVLQRQDSKAEACLKRALEIQEKSLVSFHPHMAETLEKLAAVVARLRPADSKQVAGMKTRAKAIRAAHAEQEGSESSGSGGA